MWSQGKINEIPPGIVKAKYALLSQWAWFGYFTLTLALIGLILAYGIVTPLYIVGFAFPRATVAADWVMVRGIRLLMDVQPWFNAKLILKPVVHRPTLLVSNHRSHLDAFILLSRIEGVKILAKKALFSFPGIGFIMWVSGQIPLPSHGMDSFLEAMNTIRSRLKKNQIVHVFPEMTRCPPGLKGTLSFSMAPFRVAHQEKVQIVPIVFKGTDDVWPKGRMGINVAPVSAVMLSPVDPQNFKTVLDLRNHVQKMIEEAL